MDRLRGAMENFEFGPIPIRGGVGAPGGEGALMFWIGRAPGAALHRRYVGPVGIDLHLMVITDEEEWNTGPAHRGLAMEIDGDDRVAADSATPPPPVVE